MPKDLKGKHAQELWQVAIKSLAHVLQKPDFAILKQSCQSYQMGQEAQEAGNAKLALAAFRLYESHAKQIGLTPSSRRVVKPISEPEQTGNDLFSQWLKSGGLKEHS
ncbi:MAG TPA: hypothetical protein PKA83_02810 [Pirellulaceae bacterium]|nr:hypothetical protein [Pirellulaceae bacterium]